MPRRRRAGCRARPATGAAPRAPPRAPPPAPAPAPPAGRSASAPRYASRAARASGRASRSRSPASAREPSVPAPNRVDSSAAHTSTPTPSATGRLQRQHRPERPVQPAAVRHRVDVRAGRDDRPVAGRERPQVAEPIEARRQPRLRGPPRHEAHRLRLGVRERGAVGAAARPAPDRPQRVQPRLDAHARSSVPRMSPYGSLVTWNTVFSLRRPNGSRSTRRWWRLGSSSATRTTSGTPSSTARPMR